jgi:SAM-dependent methyltransferase
MTGNSPSTLAAQIESWSAGIAFELEFWADIARTRGGRWPDDFASRMNPATPVVPWIEAMARAEGRADWRVLDVGAGPVTVLGHRSPPDLRIEIVATDPLAAPMPASSPGWTSRGPTRPSSPPAEELSAFFPAAAFDLVHCRNALDHSFDPLRGIVEMLRVVRVGGRIVLSHMANEAEREGYSGFHQHNFENVTGASSSGTSPAAPMSAPACPSPATCRRRAQAR